MLALLALLLMTTSATPVPTAASTPTPPAELHTLLMNATFKLVGEGSIGTGFVLGRPTRADPKQAWFVLITAHHVLAGMKGEYAAVFLRQESGPSAFAKLPLRIRIRDGAKDLWQHHPAADVAAMYLTIPNQAKFALLPTTMLATDEVLDQFQVHPGDSLFCLGYPYGFEANDAGFPVLRSGHIASYPLTPTSITKTILFDFNVREGNSGGPVYMVESNRVYSGGTHIGRIQFVVGLVSEQTYLEEEVKSLSEVRKTRHALGLGVVVPARFIIDTVNALPEPTAPPVSP